MLYIYLLAHSKANFCGLEALETSAHLIIIRFTRIKFSGRFKAVVSRDRGSWNINEDLLMN